MAITCLYLAVPNFSEFLTYIFPICLRRDSAIQFLFPEAALPSMIAGCRLPSRRLLLSDALEHCCRRGFCARPLARGAFDVSACLVGVWVSGEHRRTSRASYSK